MSVRFRYHDNDDHCVGAVDITMPYAPGRVTVAAVGEDKADALHRASLVAARIASDPALRHLMPESVQRRIAQAQGMAQAAKHSAAMLRSFFHRHGGDPRLAATLHKEARGRDVAGLGDEEVGLLPLAMVAASLAQKYGPTVARKMAAAIKARRARKARKAKEARERKEREAAAEKSDDAEQPHDEQTPDPASESDDTQGEE